MNNYLNPYPNFYGCYDPQCLDSTWDHECPVVPDDLKDVKPVIALPSYWPHIADQLDEIRLKICYYGADENQTCDCKYGVNLNTDLSRNEQNGCPELRDLIRIYRNQAKNVS